ncbi:MAG TPA: hypothetical protein VF112_03235, partial [Candidatus Dormibacteraeota bacterium]
EGYILYPYTPSAIKNQIRWTFGGVYPRAYGEASGGTEPWAAQTECLLEGGDDAIVEARLRFLHVLVRTIGRLAEPVATLPENPDHTLVAELKIGATTHRPWEEATERELDAGRHRCGDLCAAAVRTEVAMPAGRSLEPLAGPDGEVVGVVVRDHAELRAELEVSAERLDGTMRRVRVRVANTTPYDAGGDDRGRVMRHSLVSTHAVLGVEGGHWLSLADPPEHATAAAAGCVNTGMWPVLVGEPGDDDTVLASPIILEDHTQVAPESPGDLFDSREIDELLTLSILTLTDEEKEEMRAADPRTRAMLERTESMTPEQMMKLHGTIRELRRH